MVVPVRGSTAVSFETIRAMAKEMLCELLEKRVILKERKKTLVDFPTIILPCADPVAVHHKCKQALMH